MKTIKNALLVGALMSNVAVFGADAPTTGAVNSLLNFIFPARVAPVVPAQTGVIATVKKFANGTCSVVGSVKNSIVSGVKCVASQPVHFKNFVVTSFKQSPWKSSAVTTGVAAAVVGAYYLYKSVKAEAKPATALPKPKPTASKK